MRAATRWLLGLGATATFLLGCVSMASANQAYEEAESWFSRATYVVECLSSHGQVSPAGCARLAKRAPEWPGGVPVTDQDLLIAEAGAAHNTASAVLTLGGILFAIAGVLVAAVSVVPRHP